MPFELTPEQDGYLRKQFLMARAMAFPLVMAVFLYGFIAQTTLQKDPRFLQNGDSVSRMRMLFYVLALACVLMVPWVKKILLSKRESVSRELLDEPTVRRIATKRLIAMIVAFALYEGVVLFGLVLTTTSGRVSDYYTFALIGLAGLLYHFPKYSQWENWLSQNMQ